MLGNLEQWLECAQQVLRCQYSLKSSWRNDRELWRCEQIINGALNIDPDSAQAQYLKGIVGYAFQYGGNEEALQHLERAVYLDPSNEEYREDRDIVKTSVLADRTYRASRPALDVHGPWVF